MGSTWTTFCVAAYSAISRLIIHCRPQNLAAVALLRIEIENPFESHRSLKYISGGGCAEFA